MAGGTVFGCTVQAKSDTRKDVARAEGDDGDSGWRCGRTLPASEHRVPKPPRSSLTGERYVGARAFQRSRTLQSMASTTVRHYNRRLLSEIHGTVLREPYDHLIFMDGVVPGENVIKLDFTSPILTSGPRSRGTSIKRTGGIHLFALRPVRRQHRLPRV